MIHKVATGGSRIDTYLTKLYPDKSRSYFQKLIKLGRVVVDNKSVKPSYRVRSGENINITFPEIKKYRFDKCQKLFKVLYEDDAILVIDKSAGVVVHPASAGQSSEKTLLDILLSKYPKLNQCKWPTRPVLVHRLDKDTSGVMVVTKTPEAQKSLAEQFSNRTVKKVYLGIVHGKFNEREGYIESYLGYSGKYRKVNITPIGKLAKTRFKVLKETDSYSLLEIYPLTGRTHQIRVHLNAIGHSVVGDKVYSAPFVSLGRYYTTKEQVLHSKISTKAAAGYPAKQDTFIPRQMLHSYKLEIVHPLTKKYMTFVAPLPKDFIQCLAKLKLTKTINSLGLTLS